MNVSQLTMLRRPDGSLALELFGTAGPLVLCVPGMGEIRQSYRHLVPLLLERGFRVATLDIRGHGDSDSTFDAYDDIALGSDIVAAIDHLGEPAFVVGNSMAAGAAVIAAADAPDRVRGLALLGPFVRDGGVGVLGRLAFRLAMMKPWGPAAFLSYYPKWYPGDRPVDFDEHVARLRENLRMPGHWRAFQRTTRTSHAPAEARLGEVSAPSVVVMGDADIDWPDPEAEARWIANGLGAEVVMLEGIGHYPQAQAPVATADAIEALVARTVGA